MTTLMHLEVISKREGDVVHTAYKDLVKLPENVFYQQIDLPSWMMLPGCRVTIECPDCPDCGQAQVLAERGICKCGHSWIDWADKRYASIVREERGPDGEIIS